MNEKFKLLALQAKMGTADFDAGSYYVATPDQMQRFAELIVRECVQVCEPILDEPYEDMTEFGKGLVEGQDVAIERIKEHFGVEE
jgi:hypothetical protein